MNTILKTAAASAAILMLAGCAGISAPSGNTENTPPADSSGVISEEKAPGTESSPSEAGSSEEKNADAVSEAKLPEDRGIALISIKTKNENAGLGFVTDPVSGYVSSQIASWTPGYVKPPVPYYEDCTVTVYGADDSVSVENAEAQVKVRGNWTTSYPKKPLRIKFAEKQPMLGLNDGTEQKNWVLLAEYKDASMLRNKTALFISRGIYGDDHYAADSELVEVEINGSYRGVYLLTEQQQTGSQRVDITEPEKDYTGTDIGYFMEFDGYYTEEEPLQQFFVDYADNAPLVPYDGNGGSGRTIKCLSMGEMPWMTDTGITIKSDIYSRGQHDFIENYVNNVYRIMYSAAYEDKAYVFDDDFSDISETTDITPEEAVRNVVDVRSLADMYIISELTCDADIYFTSFFMTADFGENGNKKLTFEAPWDFDSALGNKSRCPDGTGYYAGNIIPDVNGNFDVINPWLTVLMYQDWFRDIIGEEWKKIYDSGLFDEAYELIEHDTEAYHDAFERNYSLWDNIRNNFLIVNELSDRAKSCRDQREAAEYLEEWLKARVEFMNKCWG